MLYYKQKDNRPQGGLPLKFGLKSRLLACKLQRRFFYVRNGYFLFWKMNVSNATIKIPKDIKSWKLKYTIDITSIPKNFGNATLQHGRLKNILS